MQKSMFSTFWYRVADLRPRIRAHAEIHRQQFRGQTWYLIQDHQTGKFHRLLPAAHYIVCLMDGRRTMREIWELAEARYGAETPAQDDVMTLLSQLHGADLIVAQGMPDARELDQRADRIAHQTLLSRIRNPLALRFPIWDPDRFLTATLPLVQPIFTWVGFVAWLSLVITGGVFAWVHWGELTSNLSDRVLTADNFLLIALVYPLVKGLHELGHGYATKRWGGRVHETGLMFLVLIPVPYVDASSSTAFPQWWRRAIVGGAGIMVELALAAIAVIAWVQTEPGLIRAALFNVALIGGVSTLFFNGNPLLRFDGYYVLCDLLAIPNLATRANRYVGYLVQRYAFGKQDVDNPTTAPGESFWFVVYAVLSFAYRIVIMIAIALFVATTFFFVGVVLAIWSVAAMLVWPILKGLWVVLGSAALQDNRPRAVAVTTVAAGAVTLVLLFLPLPNATLTQGVLVAPPGSSVRAETPGVVIEVIAQPGSEVALGDPLLQLEDPALHSMASETEARLDELNRRRNAVPRESRVEARVLTEEIERARDSLQRYRERIDALTVRAPASGRFVLPGAEDLVGRFVRRGQELGFALAPEGMWVRAVVPESRVALVRAGSGDAEVRLVSRMTEVLAGRVAREVPAAGDILPSHALAGAGGGAFAAEATPEGEARALVPIFQFDIVFDNVRTTRLGERAYVRFAHGDASLAEMVWRELRQLFLSKFDV